jgi:toxin ParE1/3/4
MGTSADGLGVGFRRFRFQSHYIFYTEATGFILIRALLHVRMNLRPDLFE